ncbi:MAG: hypothetical protein ABSE27_01820 [Acidobacteriaceae bacterium]|jgi:hypothetical protein
MNTVTGQNNKKVEVDSDVQAVLEFMQDRVQAGKLISVAEGVMQMARLLWGSHPQEPCSAVSLVLPKTTACSLSPQDAIG